MAKNELDGQIEVVGSTAIIILNKLAIPLGSFQCEQCDYLTVRKSNLERHVMTVHGKLRTFECETCGKTFGLKHHLEKHCQVMH